MADGPVDLTITAFDRAGLRTELRRALVVDNVEDVVDPVTTQLPPATVPDPPPAAATAVAPPPPPPPVQTVIREIAPAAPIPTTVTYRYRTWRKSTKLAALALSGVPVGARVEATCRGRGCPSRPFAKALARGGRLSLATFVGRRLRPGAVIELRVTKDGAIGKRWVIAIRRAKAPTLSRRCLLPGAAKPSACPGG
jgi:hypothetical protein